MTGIGPIRLSRSVRTTMTGNPREPKYISDALENLEEYSQYLKGIGNSEMTIGGKLRVIRRALKSVESEIGDIDVSEFDKRSYDVVVRDFERCIPRTREKDLFIISQFFGWFDEECPFFELCKVEPSTDSRRPALKKGKPTTAIQEMYSAELQDLSDRIIRSGASAEHARNVVRCVRLCFVALYEHTGVKSFDAIGLDDMRYLRSNLQLGDRVKKDYLQYFSRFLGPYTGRSLYAELDEADRREALEARIDALPYAEEIYGLETWMKTHNYRPRTIQTQLACLTSFIPRVIKIAGPVPLDQIDMELFFLLRSEIDDVKEQTLASYMKAFNNLIKFATGHSVYESRMMLWNAFDVKRMFIDRKEWDKVVDNATETDRIAIMLGSMLGLRCSEIVGLELNDIDGDTVTIRGKGHGPNGKVVRKKILPKLHQAIDRYMAYRRSIIEVYGDLSEDRLVIRDGMLAGTPMTEGALMGRLHVLSVKTGIEFSTHTFRRYYAMMMYDAGVDLNIIRTMMRHQSVDTTLQCYIQADPRLLADAGSKLEEAMFG